MVVERENQMMNPQVTYDVREAHRWVYEDAVATATRLQAQNTADKAEHPQDVRAFDFSVEAVALTGLRWIIRINNRNGALAGFVAGTI